MKCAEPTADLARRLAAGVADSLLAMRHPQGHWEGRLSSSALSTATATVALHLAGRETGDAQKHHQLVAGGLRWLVLNQNADGGWGDTPASISNISTTTLCWAALGLAGQIHSDGSAPQGLPQAVARAQEKLRQMAGGLEPDQISQAILTRYGKDRTFSVPILTMAALCGRLGEGADAWKLVKQLPFELAAFPRRMFRLLNLQVVSYALPALIAIGLARHRRKPTWLLPLRWLRDALARRVLAKLQRIQPPNGGFLEATPLTSFVLMSLAAAGEARGNVAGRCERFLAQSVREDGSWPIDTNLATWVTTLAIHGLSRSGDRAPLLPENERRSLLQWLLGQQYRVEHPYTGAAPGGWAWTDLPGGVPDADDTSGAILAIAKLAAPGDEARVRQAMIQGADWLAGLQNRDGGVPTFCRGWGKLGFDQSCADITAHAIRAWLAAGRVADGGGRHSAATEGKSEPNTDGGRWRESVRRGLRYLVQSQQASAGESEGRPSNDGRWDPLWFGNQQAAGETNGVYGTSRVLVTLGEWLMQAMAEEGAWGAGGDEFQQVLEAGRRGAAWLLRARSAPADGAAGWGGEHGCDPSIEETALAVEGLAAMVAGVDAAAATAANDTVILEEIASMESEIAQWRQAIHGGLLWLDQRTEGGRSFHSSPIGFYFAKLWYDEQLYPALFAAAAAGAAQRSGIT